MAFINTTDLRDLQDNVSSALRFLRGEGEKVAATEALVRAQYQLAAMADGIADPGLRDDANERYASDEIEIDDEPGTAPADGGTWVAAWVWVADPEEGECATCAASIETRVMPCDECGCLDEEA